MRVFLSQTSPSPCPLPRGEGSGTEPGRSPSPQIAAGATDLPAPRSGDDVRPQWIEALFWAVALSALFMVVYGGCNWITSRRSDVGTFFFEWERYIPFVSVFIIPYMTIDLFFVGSMFVCGSRRELHVLARRIAAAICIAGTCFLLFPLQLGFKKPEVSGFLGGIFQFLWGFDQPYNLAPSLHIALRSILWFVYVAHTTGLLQRVVRVWFVLVGVSTLLTWQHHVMDVVTGQLLALMCFYLFPGTALDTTHAVTWLTPGRANYRLSAIFAGLSAVSLIAALVIQSWGWLLLWPAFSLAVMAGGYLAGSPAVFRKSAGRIPLSARIWLAPYFVASWLSFLHFRRGAPPFVQVAPGLYLGRRLTDREAELLVQSGVAAVLDLTAEFSQCRRLLGLRYQNVPILDLTVPTTQQIDRCLLFTRQFSREGGVYVHCALGYSRSALIAAAHLLATGQADSPEAAVEILRRARPQIVLREAALRALRDYYATATRQGD